MPGRLTDALARLAMLLDLGHPVVLTLVKVTLVLLVAVAAASSLRRAAAGIRHLVWLVALLALLVLPPVAIWAPLPLPVLPDAGAALLAPTSDPGPALNDPAKPLAARPEALPAGAGTVAPVTDSGSGPVDLGLLLFSVWGLGALVLLARLGHGLWAVSRVARAARPLHDPAWQTPLYEIADRLGLDHAPRLVQSAEVKMPFAAGLWSPTIVLPADSEGWDAERRSAVLIHELGHVRRRDLVGHMLSRVACVLYWFHPLVWTAARRLRAESERACDDLALLFGARPSEYAEHLLDIVTCVRDHNTPAVALAMAHRREFEGRMLAILDPELSRRGPSRARTALGMASLAGFALLVGAAAPVPRTTIASSERQAGSPVRPVPPESLVLPVPEVIAPAATRTATHTSTRTVTRTDTASELDGAAVASASGAASQAGVPGGDRMTALVRALRRDSSPEVRRTAAWGLKRYAENDTAAGALAAALQGDASAAVREMSAWALANARAGGTGAQAIMRALRAEKDPAVRSTAIWVAGEIGDGSSVATLATMLADSSADVREVAAWAIGQCNPDKAPPALVRALGDASRDVRLSVAWALYEIEDSGTVVALDAAFQKETDGEVQVGLLRALGSAGESAVPTLEKLVTSPNPEVRRIAVAALAGGQATGPWPWPRPRPRPYP